MRPALLLLLTLTLFACGKSGPLVLPPDDSASQQAPKQAR